jgi:hypothetical protein
VNGYVEAGYLIVLGSLGTYGVGLLARERAARRRVEAGTASEVGHATEVSEIATGPGCGQSPESCQSPGSGQAPGSENGIVDPMPVAIPARAAGRFAPGEGRGPGAAP